GAAPDYFTLQSHRRLMYLRYFEVPGARQKFDGSSSPAAYLHAMSKRELIWLAGSVWTVGLIGLLCEHLHSSAVIINSARALFGVGACAATGLALVANGSHDPDPYQFTRWVTRWVYILMYMLAVVRVALSFGETPVRPLD